MATLHIDKNTIHRLHIEFEGAVQGVGFRPFIYRLAQDLKLSGFVQNSNKGVSIEVEGPTIDLDAFFVRAINEAPAHSLIHDMQLSVLPVHGRQGFVIKDSLPGMLAQTFVLPDIATCPECLEEIFDPQDRRYLYPFTNCTHCGPRFSIVEDLPYDRANTSMKDFTMCFDCQQEYHDPENRRFHAQPNACPVCGPSLELWDSHGKLIAQKSQSIEQACEAIGQGKIVAVKGIGGFQLFVDATCPQAVELLRERKHRQQKPLALMFPTLALIKQYCTVSMAEAQLLASPQSPIVLLAKRRDQKDVAAIAEAVSFQNPRWGVMLPYSPLHHLIMRKVRGPVVATSANFSQEPMCIDNLEALQKLNGIADIFLVHDRPVVRPVDDSVGIMIKDKFCLIRRARGYAPLPIVVEDSEPTILAVGSQMKNTVALKVRDKVYLSQHLGDLESPEAVAAFNQGIKSLRAIYPQSIDCIATDQHPDYFATRFAVEEKEPKIYVQHHHAHIVACMAEHKLKGPVLGLAWDGTGLGEDKAIWGSEFLVSTLSEYQRVGHLLPFQIPGGDASIRQPRRTALGILTELFGQDLNSFRDLAPVKTFSVSELKNIQQMISQGINAPWTTSMGRLFDGVSALLGLCQVADYEGQAAMALENILPETYEKTVYPWRVDPEDGEGKEFVLDWRDMLAVIIGDILSGTDRAKISMRFHNTLVAMAVDVAKNVGIREVVLSGGCFQNKYLTEHLIDRLRQEGFVVYWPSKVPANDGGISLGQAVIAAERLKKNKG